MDITETLAPKSDQLNADDLIGTPRTVTITGVSRGEADQPVNIELAEYPGRPYRPCKSMRRVLVFAWGPDASAYAGRRMKIFNDQSVKWGGQDVGGIRISALSHIDKALTVSLTETRGKRKPYRVEPLADEPQQTPSPPSQGAELNALFAKGGLPKDRREERVVVVRKIVARDVASAAELTEDELGHVVDELKGWDVLGKLADKLADILDMAALEAESKP